MEKIKTTLYDIVGYIIPGMVFLVASFVGYCHLVQCQQPFVALRAVIKGLSNTEIAIYLGITYLAGHLLSTASYFVFEKLCCNTVVSDKQILGDDLYKAFEDRFKSIFKVAAYDKKTGFLTCICYVEAKQPVVYATAFIFQSFYGMARNLALVLMVYSLWELYNGLVVGNRQSFAYLLVAALVCLICFWHYRRFSQYYRRYILTGFIIT
jgi:hypothetical protein